MTWTCDKECPYRRYPKIPPSKTFDADLAIVGEAPGIKELGAKEPFVGPSGDILERSLKAANLPSKNQIFITNALLCRPPKSPVKVDAIRHCSNRVLQELKEVNPKVVLLLGSSALKSLTEKANASITREHSKAFSHPELPDSIIVPAFHPAALFRNPGNYITYIQALIYASILLQKGPNAIKTPGETKYTVLDTVQKCQNLFDELIDKDQETIIHTDIETGGFNQFEDPILCLGMCINEGHTYIIPVNDLDPTGKKYDNVVSQIPKSYFKHPKLKWCWHDGSFDTPFLRLSEDVPAKVDHDTILLHYCLNEHAGSHGLGILAKRFLGADSYEHKVKKHVKSKNRGYREVPKKVLYPYLAKDCDYTKRLFDLFISHVESDENLNKLYYDLLIPATKFLRGIFEHGIYVNTDHAKKLDKQLETKENRIRQKIQELLDPIWDSNKYKQDRDRKSAGMKNDESVINPGSTYQLAWVLFDELGLPAISRKGRSVDKEVMKKLEGRHPVIPLITKYRSLRKRRSTYVKGILKRMQDDGRIHSRFSLYRTLTGRLSSRNPNLQNIQKEKEIRSIFKAPPGRTILDIDYSGAELRTLQYLSGDQTLLKIFNEGRDLHDEVAIDQFGEDFTSKDRMKAKTLNFGGYAEIKSLSHRGTLSA